VDAVKQEPAPGPATSLGPLPCPALGRGEPTQQNNRPGGGCKPRLALQPRKGLGCSAPLDCLGLFFFSFLAKAEGVGRGKAWFFPTRGVHWGFFPLPVTVGPSPGACCPLPAPAPVAAFYNPKFVNKSHVVTAGVPRVPVTPHPRG